MNFHATLHPVPNRGMPTVPFLTELVNFFKTAPDEICSPNPHHDIYSVVAPVLGPFTSQQHRVAVMCEVLRVLAGFESSWNWTEGVDTTNQSSLHNINGQETGIFQVSFDSVGFDPSLAECVRNYTGTLDVHLFISQMKTNHGFAIEFCAKLLRVNTCWSGPTNRGWTAANVRRDAVAEFQTLLSSP